jgi:hypothetical protein
MAVIALGSKDDGSFGAGTAHRMKDELSKRQMRAARRTMGVF